MSAQAAVPRHMYAPLIATDCYIAPEKIEPACYQTGPLPTMRAAHKPAIMPTYPRKASIVMAAQSPNHMVSSLGPVAGSMNGCGGIERRGAVRVAIPFPATVRGRVETGDRF